MRRRNRKYIKGKIPNRAKRQKPRGVFILEFKDVIDYLVDDFALAFGLRPHIWWREK